VSTLVWISYKTWWMRGKNRTLWLHQQNVHKAQLDVLACNSTERTGQHQRPSHTRLGGKIMITNIYCKIETHKQILSDFLTILGSKSQHLHGWASQTPMPHGSWDGSNQTARRGIRWQAPIVLYLCMDQVEITGKTSKITHVHYCNGRKVT